MHIDAASAVDFTQWLALQYLIAPFDARLRWLAKMLLQGHDQYVRQGRALDRPVAGSLLVVAQPQAAMKAVKPTFLGNDGTTHAHY